MTITKSDNRSKYWRANLKVLGILLAVWFIAGYVLSIFAVEKLNEIHIGGFPLGFWFAQQGSIYVFIVLTYIYSRWMRKIDREFGLHEGDNG